MKQENTHTVSDAASHAIVEGGAHAAPATTVTPQVPGDVLVVDELLVEEISIDGMCGVY